MPVWLSASDVSIRVQLFRVCVFPFDVSDGRCGIIVSIPVHCLPFYFAGVEISRRDNTLLSITR